MHFSHFHLFDDSLNSFVVLLVLQCFILGVPCIDAMLATGLSFSSASARFLNI